MEQREIKFRCWNTAAKAMYPAEHFALTLEGKELQLMDRETMSYQPNPGHMIYMQYTGLKDKNGKEIWEGDLVAVDEHDDPYEVIFTQGGFWLDGYDSEYGWPPEDMLKVTGNKYESVER